MAFEAKIETLFAVFSIEPYGEICYKVRIGNKYLRKDRGILWILTRNSVLKMAHIMRQFSDVLLRFVGEK